MLGKDANDFHGRRRNGRREFVFEVHSGGNVRLVRCKMMQLVDFAGAKWFIGHYTSFPGPNGYPWKVDFFLRCR